MEQAAPKTEAASRPGPTMMMKRTTLELLYKLVRRRDDGGHGIERRNDGGVRRNTEGENERGRGSEWVLGFARGVDEALIPSGHRWMADAWSVPWQMASTTALPPL